MNIVIGAIVGSDIYIVPGITAGLLGPLAILAWILAGAISIVLVIVFGYCSYYVPEVGGPFAFVSKAFDNFFGFIAGWSMCIAELVVLPVFAVVFTNYLQFFVSLPEESVLLVRVIFVITLVIVNMVGVKAAGRVNDALTLLKLSPLLLIIVLGFATILLRPSLSSNYVPFAPLGFGRFNDAFILIFWAYAGFELGSLPSGEVRDPKKNVPRAVISGMAIVVFFYVMTSISVFGVVNWSDLSRSSTPLMLVSVSLIGTAGAFLTGFGAIASVSGTEETEILGTARLIYAMSIEGLLPSQLSKIHSRFKTPYIALLVEGSVAIALSIFSTITQLISFAVFNLGICYLLVCLSLSVLKNKREALRGQNVLPWVGAAISIYLLYSSSPSDKIVGTILVIAGIPIYLIMSRKTNLRKLPTVLKLEEENFGRNIQRQNAFLANFVRMVAGLIRRVRRKE